jgi:dUTP pyrophosphatase
MALTTPIFVKIQRTKNNNEVPLPCRATAGSAGYDLRACMKAPLTLKPGTIEMFGTGWAVEIPEGYQGEIRPRSSVGLQGLLLVNSPATIDSDYRGEIKLAFVNLGPTTKKINPGDKMAQLIITEVRPVRFLEVDNLKDTARGKGGFGSTGK